MKTIREATTEELEAIVEMFKRSNTAAATLFYCEALDEVERRKG